MTAPGWPAVVSHDRVGLRPMRLRDRAEWTEVRLRNQGWLEPWEGAPVASGAATWSERHGAAVFTASLRSSRRQGREGSGLPFVVTYDGHLAGQVTVSNIVRGAFDSGSVGYWVDRELAGRGVTPTAVALAVDHAFAGAGLHRIEVNVRPENAPSLRVVDKLGFRAEGRHERYLYIDGAWRDHLTFALVREDVPGGLLRRYLATRDTPRDTPPGLHPV